MAPKAEGSSVTQFLNVDLDISSRFDLQPLIDCLGRKVIALHVGRDRRRYWARIELARAMKSADSTIRAFCSLIRALPKEERHLWDSANSRDFSIGVQTGEQPHSCDFVVEAGTVAAVSELNGRIVFTIYAPSVPTDSAT